jgi:cell division protein FtsW
MRKKPDYFLVAIVLSLIFLGILILASVSSPFSQEKFGHPSYFLFHQIGLGILPGIGLGFLAFFCPLTFLRKWIPIIFLINLLLLILVFSPLGASFGGATRWLKFGPIFFQPSEFLKLSFLVYLAAWLARDRAPGQIKKKKEFNQNLVPFLVMIGIISLGLIFQPDISTLGVLVICAGVLYFLAKTPLWHSLVLFLIGISSLIALIKVAPYRMARILVFLDPQTDPLGIGYQIKQALIAIGSGGILGLGLGLSQQKFGFLPQPMSDSIFAVFAEESGFLGATLLISLFFLFLFRGIQISKKVNDNFLKLSAVGICCWISLQALINIGSMIGILPLSGTPLPFISYGGSHLIAELTGVGILLNISKNL